MGDEVERERLLIYERTRLKGSGAQNPKLKYTARTLGRTTESVNSISSLQNWSGSTTGSALLGLATILFILGLVVDSGTGTVLLALAAISFSSARLLRSLYYNPQVRSLESHPVVLCSGRLIKTGYLFMKPTNSTTLAGNCNPGLSAALVNMGLNGGMILTKRQLLYFIKTRSLTINGLLAGLRSKAAGLAKAYEAVYNVRLAQVDAPTELIQALSLRAIGFSTSSNARGSTVRASSLSGRYHINLLPRLPLLNRLGLNDNGVALVSFAPVGGILGWLRTWWLKWSFAKEMEQTSLYDNESSEKGHLVASARRVLSYDKLFTLCIVVLTFGRDPALHSQNVESLETSMGIEMEQHPHDEEEGREFIRGFRISTPRSVELKGANPVSAVRRLFSFDGIAVTPADLEYVIYPPPSLKGYTIVPVPKETTGDVLIGNSVDQTFRDVYPYRLATGDLVGNVLAIGTTGSGKSVTTATLVTNLQDNVLVFDWNGEYSRALGPEGFKVYRIGDHSYNPFERVGVSSEEAPLRLTELTNNLMAYAYHQPLTPTQYRLLADALREMENYSLRILVKKIKQKMEGETRADVLRAWESLYTKLVPLDQKCFIPSGDVVHCDQLLLGKNVVNIQGMRDDGKLFLIMSMLENLYRIATRGELSERLVVVVDEAHRLQYKASREMDSEKPTVGLPPPIVERITRECRKHGLNMILITQTPSGVTDEVQANLGVVICHRMKGREAEVADSIIGLSRRFGREATAGLLTLPTGYAYVETTSTPLQLVHMAATERALISLMEVGTRD